MRKSSDNVPAYVTTIGALINIAMYLREQHERPGTLSAVGLVADAARILGIDGLADPDMVIADAAHSLKKRLRETNDA